MPPDPLLVLADPDELALIQWLNPRITQPMLEEISMNDCGEEGPAHLTGIQLQLRPSLPPGLLPWCPREVLELERWREPDETHIDSPQSGERGHLKRLFACAILLRNGAYVSAQDGLSEEDFFLQTSAASLDRLTRSAIAIEVPRLALGFILWLFQVQKHPRLRPFIAFCARVLASAMEFGDMPERDIVQICDWVDDEEKQCRDLLGDDVETEQWLIGLNPYEERHGKRWASLATNLPNARKGFSEAIDLRLRKFSNRLKGSSAENGE